MSTLYPLVSAEKWAEAHGIRAEKVACPKCGANLSLTLPVAIPGYRGLSAKPCATCGEESGVVILAPVGRTEREFWEEVRTRAPVYLK